MFKSNPRKLSKETSSQSSEKLKFKTIPLPEITQFLVMFTSHNHTSNQSNKEKTWKSIGNKNRIMLLIEMLLPEMLFTKADLDHKLLMFQEMFTINKMLLDLLLTKKEFKFNSNKDLLKRLEDRKSFTQPKLLVLNKLLETLFLTKSLMKSLLVFLNLLFMTFLFIITNTFLLKSLATLVVVVKIMEMVLLRLLTLPKLKFSEMEEKSYQKKAAIEVIIKEEKLSQKRRISKMLLIITAVFTEVKLSVETQDLLGEVLMILTFMEMEMIRKIIVN